MQYMASRKFSVSTLLFVLLCIPGFTGCSHLHARLTYTFKEWKGQPRIHYEPGAEDLAMKVAGIFEEDIKRVEKGQYIAFRNVNEINVYIFNSKERYSKYSLASIRSRGSATTSKIYLSPILRDRIDTLPKILTHELSHVHLRQYVGSRSSVMIIPGWFHEGLAVETSGGGGAEKISEMEAIVFIKSGHHFVPTESGSIFGHKTATDYGLKPHMYYRQASLFVRFLRRRDPVAFRQAYIALSKGEDFDEIWPRYYSKSVKVLWDEFMAGLQA